MTLVYYATTTNVLSTKGRVGFVVVVVSTVGVSRKYHPTAKMFVGLLVKMLQRTSIALLQGYCSIARRIDKILLGPGFLDGNYRNHDALNPKPST